MNSIKKETAANGNFALISELAVVNVNQKHGESMEIETSALQAMFMALKGMAVTVLSFHGASRIGKSTLVNNLMVWYARVLRLNTSPVFQTHDDSQPCTKGVFAAAMCDMSKAHAVVFMDTEGYPDLTKPQFAERARKIQTLAIACARVNVVCTPCLTECNQIQDFVKDADEMSDTDGNHTAFLVLLTATLMKRKTQDECLTNWSGSLEAMKNVSEQGLSAFQNLKPKLAVVRHENSADVDKFANELFNACISANPKMQGEQLANIMQKVTESVNANRSVKDAFTSALRDEALRKEFERFGSHMESRLQGLERTLRHELQLGLQQHANDMSSKLGHLNDELRQSHRLENGAPEPSRYSKRVSGRDPSTPPSKRQRTTLVVFPTSKLLPDTKAIARQTINDLRSGEITKSEAVKQLLNMGAHDAANILQQHCKQDDACAQIIGKLDLPDDRK
jgi:hypothetical protein